MMNDVLYALWRLNAAAASYKKNNNYVYDVNVITIIVIRSK